MPATRARRTAAADTVNAPYETPPGEIVYARLACASYLYGRGTYHAGLRLTDDQTDAFEEACWRLFQRRYPSHGGMFGLPVHLHEDGRGRFIKMRSYTRPRVFDPAGNTLPAAGEYRVGLAVGSLYPFRNAERAGVSFFLDRLIVAPDQDGFGDAFPCPVEGF